MADLITIRHAETKNTARIPAAALPHYAARGWERADDAPLPTSGPAAGFVTMLHLETRQVADIAAGAVDGWRQLGWVPVEEVEQTPKPAGNASHEAWVEYAKARGMDPDEAAEMGRDELRERFAD